MSLFFIMTMQWLKTCLVIAHHSVSLDLFDNGLNNGPCATHETEKKNDRVICDDDKIIKKWCSEFENNSLVTLFFVILIEAF